MSLCLQCDNQKFLIDSTSTLANWLKQNNRETALPPNAPPPTRKPFHPKDADTVIHMIIGGPDRCILWWGADPAPVNSALKTAVQGYNKYKNMGIAKVKNGKVTFVCFSPRPYKEEGRVWPPHLHFVNPCKNLSKWRTRVFAVAAYPGHHSIGKLHYSMGRRSKPYNGCSLLRPEEVLANLRKLIVVSALPLSVPPIVLPRPYKVMHIPHASDQAVLNKAAKEIGERAYVVYCAHSKCGAASHLIEQFMKCKDGAKNAYYMPLGQRGWNRMMKKK